MDALMIIIAIIVIATIAIYAIRKNKLIKIQKTSEKGGSGKGEAQKPDYN